MENADKDLTEIENQLRALAAADHAARPEDAALLARLCEKADAACGHRPLRPWYRSPMLWRSAAALALLAALPSLWVMMQPGTEQARVVVTKQESAPAPGPCAIAVAEPPAEFGALPAAGGGVPAPAAIAMNDFEAPPVDAVACAEETVQEMATESAVAVNTAYTPMPQDRCAGLAAPKATAARAKKRAAAPTPGVGVRLKQFTDMARKFLRLPAP